MLVHRVKKEGYLSSFVVEMKCIQTRWLRRTQPLLWSCSSLMLCTLGPPVAGTLPLDNHLYHRELMLAALFAGVTTDGTTEPAPVLDLRVQFEDEEHMWQYITGIM